MAGLDFLAGIGGLDDANAISAVNSQQDPFGDPVFAFSFDDTSDDFFDTFEDDDSSSDEEKKEQGPSLIEQGGQLLRDVFDGAVDLAKDAEAVQGIASIITALRSDGASVSSEEKKELEELKQKLVQAQAQAQNDALRQQLAAQQAQITAILGQSSAAPDNKMLLIGGAALVAVVALLALRK